MKNLIRHLACTLGIKHYYKDENATSTFAFSEDGCDFYRIENRCVYCGKHRCWLQHVRIERNEL